MSSGATETRHDAVRLNVILSEMESCKDDSQQRSWALHEDEEVILEYLEELLSILVRITLNSKDNCIIKVYYQC